jgi:DnaK suppressor protein
LSKKPAKKKSTAKPALKPARKAAAPSKSAARSVGKSKPAKVVKAKPAPINKPSKAAGKMPGKKPTEPKPAPKVAASKPVKAVEAKKPEKAIVVAAPVKSKGKGKPITVVTKPVVKPGAKPVEPAPATKPAGRRRGKQPARVLTPLEAALEAKPGAVVAKIDAVKLAAYNKAMKAKLAAQKPLKKDSNRPAPGPSIVAAPTPAPPTAEKALKNRAGFLQKDLEFFRDLLLAKRRELVGDMNSMEREALRETSSDLSNLPVHMADQGTDAYEQEFTLNLVEQDRVLLRELNNALAKIQNGSYGLCEGTGQPISRARLEAQPWARHSIEHARAMEKKQMMFRR